MDITLKPWTKGSAGRYLEMMEHVDFTYEDEELKCTDPTQAIRNIDEMIRNEDYNGDFYRAVLLDGKVVGHVQVARQAGVWNCDGHVGCMIVREAWHQGVGSEAVRQMVEMAFTRRNYNRLTAVVYHPNRASMRVVEKNGFTLEATLHHAVRKGDGIYYNALVYGLLREDTGIGTTDCCEPEDELAPEELAALEPTLVPPRKEEWTPLDPGRFEHKRNDDGIQLKLFEW